MTGSAGAVGTLFATEVGFFATEVGFSAVETGLGDARVIGRLSRVAADGDWVATSISSLFEGVLGVASRFRRPLFDGVLGFDFCDMALN